MSGPLLVLLGGTSTEHRVSVASGQTLLAALPGASAWFLSREGSVHALDRDRVLRHEQPFVRDLDPGPPTWPTLASALDAAHPASVLVLALHGGEGENGTLQRELERRRLAFTGCGSAASAAAFDKHRAREIVSAAGVRVAEATLIAPGDPEGPDRVRAIAARHGGAALKPVADGSSFGLALARDERELAAALEVLRAARVPYLAEAFIRGTELTVGVLHGTGPARALPASEVRIDPGGSFDYAGKYLGRGTRELTPAQVPDDVARAAQDLAVRAHLAIGGEGYSRTDVIAAADGPVFLEINTLPGLTSASFYPQQLAAAGISLRSFLDEQIALARRRV